jgi:hypothetical protein
MDLSSDPFGWEEEGDHSEEDDVDDTTGRDDDDDDARCRNSLFLHGCTMNKLSLVAMAIRRAAAAIEARLGTTAGGRNPSGDTLPVVVAAAVVVVIVVVGALPRGRTGPARIAPPVGAKVARGRFGRVGASQVVRRCSVERRRRWWSWTLLCLCLCRQ